MKVRHLLVLVLVFCFSDVFGANIVVNTGDLSVIADDGNCTLTEAVNAANQNIATGVTAGECIAGDPYPAVDEITFDLDIFPVYMTTAATFVLNEPVKITGPSAELMSIASIALARVFEIENIQANAYFEISGMTLRDNSLLEITGDYGGALLASLSGGSELLLSDMVFFNNSSQRGGGAIGLFGGNNNLITIRNCTFEANFASNFGNDTTVGGGAIFIGADQNVVIENSTFFNNYTSQLPLPNPQGDSSGGAILMRSAVPFISTLEITRSTFSNNQTAGFGGAIALGGPGFPSDSSELTVRHSTITGNRADTNNDQTGGIRGGGGIYSSSITSMNIFNTIIALNIDSSDTPAADLTGITSSFGYNLIGDNSGVAGVFPAGQPNANDDWVGTAAAVLDPRLDALDDYGGPTLTHRPQVLSVVLDQGRCTAQLSDQRYFHNAQTGSRILDIGNLANANDGCDIGAVEQFTISSNPVPVTVADTYNTLEGQMLTVTAAIGLLSNDTDNDPLVVTFAEIPVPGSVDGDFDFQPNGAVTFTTDDEDDNGEVAFIYRVSDGLNVVDGEGTITVIPVNDPPELSVAATTIAAVPGQPQTIEAWASATAGPADEQGQVLAYVIATLNAPAGFFSSDPVVDEVTGDLSFEIASGATGSAEVSFVVTDNGGTANGGDNESDEVIVTFGESLAIFADGFEDESWGQSEGSEQIEGLE